jgi:hypothetical protein
VKLPSSFDHAGHKSQDTSDLLSSTPCDWSTLLPFTFLNQRWFHPLKLNNWKKWPQTNCYHEAMRFPQRLERHLMHYPIRSQKLKIRVYVFLSHDTFIKNIYFYGDKIWFYRKQNTISKNISHPCILVVNVFHRVPDFQWIISCWRE